MLLRAGLRTTPAPAPAFLAGLAARLVADAEARLRIVRLPARVRHRLPVVAAAVAMIAAVVLVGALAGWFGRGPDSHSLALAGAVDTTVLFPDGTKVAGYTGLTLPDGAVVRTGPNGRATAGNVELGPALEALVDAGALHLRASTGDVLAADEVAGAATSTSRSSTTSSTVVVATTTTTKGATVTTKAPVPTTKLTATTNAATLHVH